MRPDATSRLRMTAYCLVLTALAFVQQPGRIVGDTKFDLVADPARFLARATHLWDPSAAFGQIGNQAYGYFWPMGPFFLLGHALAIPEWVVQRLWWSALLCLAFVGTVKVARALDLGKPWTQVVGGFAFALSAHVLTLLGPTSVEAWPSAWAPWVLLPLIHASREGSIRRGAALSALAVAMCGGVNATAVSATLPLGVLWLVTRERGGVRLRLFGWWSLFTILATVWWVVPLLLLGRYSVPFLDYIENAPITTLPTDISDILGGTSDWVAYISSEDWVAGHLLGTTPFLLVNAAVVAGAGVAGIARRDNPERSFLLLGVLVGVALVSFGYVGPLDGWWSHDRLALLDAELAPFRNLHKYDVVLRLSLVLGLAHFLTVMAESMRFAVAKMPQRVVTMAVVVSVVGLAVPAYAGRLAPPGSFDGVPEYWRRAAAYLADAPGGVALEVPANAFGDYRWGSPHDDVLQPLMSASAPWAARNIIPLAQPGNVRMLDAVTQIVEGGRPNPALASFLAANGVGYLVVRNDLSATRSGAPDPVVLHQALDGSPRLFKVAEFGPTIGADAVSYKKGIRIVSNRGRQAGYRAVEIYAVAGARGQVSAWTAQSVPVVAGDPAAGLTHDAEILDGPTILAGDASEPFRSSPTVLTDGLRRREMAFTSVRSNESATMTRGQPWTIRGVVHNHRIYPQQRRFETQARWVGVASVEASSSRSDADTAPPVRRDQSPGEAIDRAPWTEWVSGDPWGAVGQWWRVALERPTALDEVRIRAGDQDGPAVTRLRITTSVGSRVADAPHPGSAATYSLPDGATKFLEIRAVAVKGGGRGFRFSIAEVRLPGVEARRFLATPNLFDRPPDEILLNREVGRPPCVVVGDATACDDFWELFGEQELTVRRIVRMPADAEYVAQLTATPRRGPAAVRKVSRALPVHVETSEPLSRTIRASGLAVLDGDPRTAWVAAPGGTPYLRLTWDRPTALSTIAIDLSASVPGARPRKVLLTAGTESRTVPLVGGRGTFDRLVTDEVRIDFPSVERAYSFEHAEAVRLPVAVGEVRFPGSEVPTVDPDGPLPFACGTGPAVSVNGEAQRSRLDATLSTILSGETLPATLCSDGRVSLRAGDNRLELSRAVLSRPEGLSLTRSSAPGTAGPQRVDVAAKAWTPTARTVRVASRSKPALLVVNENINAGWVAESKGHTLRPQRVNGWVQGWVLPPGPATQVVLRFTPNRGYQWALLGGLAALVVVVAAAAIPGRRRLGWAAASHGESWPLFAVALVAGGLIAGWVGFGLMAVAVALGRTLKAWAWAGYVAGASVALAGVAQALARGNDFEIHSFAAQLLAFLGLVFSVAALGAKGPEFFRRRKGRSST